MEVDGESRGLLTRERQQRLGGRLSPNSDASKSSSVAVTWCVKCSYSAIPWMKARSRGTSAAVAGRMVNRGC